MRAVVGRAKQQRARIFAAVSWGGRKSQAARQRSVILFHSRSVTFQGHERLAFACSIAEYWTILNIYDTTDRDSLAIPMILSGMAIK